MNFPKTFISICNLLVVFFCYGQKVYNKKIISLHKVEGFCLDKYYKPINFQNVELITGKEELEFIASNNCDVERPIKEIDFVNSYIVAIIIDNKIGTLNGAEPINIEFILDTCYRTRNHIEMKFWLKEIARNNKDALVKQLHLFQIPIDDSLESISVMNGNGLSGRGLTLPKKLKNLESNVKTNCDEYLKTSDSLGKNHNNLQGSIINFARYKNCLKDDTSIAAIAKLNKIKDFDLISFSANKKAGWAFVKQARALYLIDSNYNILMPLPYATFRHFTNENSFAVLVNNSFWNFLNTNGKLINNQKYDRVGNFSCGMAQVVSNAKYGFIDKNGIEIIPLKYSYAFHFSEELVAVHLNGKYGFIDKKGKPLTAFKYTYVHDFKNGFARVEIDHQFTFINKYGKEITPFKYSSIRDFQEGLAVVSKDKKFGFINEKGVEVIPLIYSSAEEFKNGIGQVLVDGEFIAIDKNGVKIN